MNDLLAPSVPPPAPALPDEVGDFRAWLYAVTPSWHWDWPHLAYIRARLDRVTTGELRRLMLFIPPRHGKSEQTTIRYPVYRMEVNPTIRACVGCYNQRFAERFGRKSRRIARERLKVSEERAAVSEWETTAGGVFRTCGVGSPPTGEGFDLIVIDDPIKSREEAESVAYRERVWDWYRDDLYTRLEPGGAIILIQCMTGDTPVRMCDGTENLLRDIRVGDSVATYDGGTLGASTVMNHASRGYDNIYRIITTSGAVVRANARHPFLVDDRGQLRWVRLSELTTGQRIVTVRDSGANGRAAFAPSRAAASALVAEDSARRTTTNKSGQTGIAPLRSVRQGSGSGISNIATESPLRSTTRCSPRKAASAPFASSHPATMFGHTGAENSASIIATTSGPCAGCSATIAISPLATPSPNRPRERWSNTSDFTTERIVSIEPAGVAEVFDLQIAHTENFIANGLVSHNTRWHEDDLAGRILGSEDADQWSVIVLPAEAEDGDPLGRAVGAPLCPERYPLEALAERRRVLGAASYGALYQQRPRPREGALFKEHWFKRRWRDDGQGTAYVIDGKVVPVKHCHRYAVMDPAGGVSSSADYTAVACFDATPTGDLIVVDIFRERVELEGIVPTLERLCQEWRPGHVCIETGFFQGSIVRQARKSLKIPPVRELNPGGKEKLVRSLPAIIKAEAGQIILPVAAGWLPAFMEELLKFTGKGDAHDDMVDCLAYGVTDLEWFGSDSGEPMILGAR